MNTKNSIVEGQSSILLYIGGIGFMFEVNHSYKHNLISPDVLAFFEGVSESKEVSNECAFPLLFPNTNLRKSIFQYIGVNWVICSDGIFRKCQKVQCRIEYNSIINTVVFHVDRTIVDENVVGIISQ